MLLLASSSPRRSELLKMAGYEFTAAPANVSETFLHGTPPMQIVEQLATRKAQAVAKQHPEAVVLAADTLVVLKGRILGKPKDADAAKAMLKLLSGNVHQVYTGYTVISGKKLICGHECTSVEFYALSQQEIDAYVDSGEPLDKAGAYGIQGRGALFVKRINGDYYNIVGLPISKIHRILSGLQEKDE
ncbi:Septum formation protein Maf [Caprobacter fermentans]|uniref:dTTP/UTP pyrophosphatase n=1 Tax=Caproicibacter fermentans TaxID=2576756 RepID=A0A6N8I0C9_9FIRM|nr:Maf family protein [Caproicibacter fermentans]MVB11013.1 Septum formation protein Maf [Caproicibacter fermentans]OCN01712.1 septum formation protein Maf [Clostridium sp. W14A]